MDHTADVRQFLATRRARITPTQAGLSAYGASRRVPGLRREEVAMLAGVSVDYYVRLERGNLRGVSEEVLEALAGALQLDEAEREHLFALARAANASPRSRTRRQAAPKVRPVVQRILDSMTGVPAYVRNGRMDVLATNRLGAALYSPVLTSPVQPVNTARFTFLDPHAPVFFRDWEKVTDDAVAILRAEAGRNPHDRTLIALIGELSTRSEVFRTLWADHNVRYHRTGTKRLHHSVVGDLELAFEAMDLPADTGLRILAYSAEPGSPSEDGLNLLASWATTSHEQHAVGVREGH